VPPGVINVLTGIKKELVPWLASHMDVNALDLAGVPEHLLPEVEAAAAENVKRTVREGSGDYFSDSAKSPYAITALMEMKTVWHPMGA
jgi:acyl-CoA reductase-like NAD-dependent aldehyde dehydrogenase